MNVYSDLRTIDQTVTRLRNSRAKLLSQAINIRKSIATIIASECSDCLERVINDLEDAAAIIENELNSAAPHD